METTQSHYNCLKFYNLYKVMEHINNIYLFILSFICLYLFGGGGLSVRL